jgi:hypothetical protein
MAGDSPAFFVGSQQSRTAMVNEALRVIEAFEFNNDQIYIELKSRPIKYQIYLYSNSLAKLRVK